MLTQRIHRCPEIVRKAAWVCVRICFCAFGAGLGGVVQSLHQSPNAMPSVLPKNARHCCRASGERGKIPFDLTRALPKSWDRAYPGNSLHGSSRSQSIPWACPTFQELARSQGQGGGGVPKELVDQPRACWQKEVASSGYRLHHHLWTEEKAPPFLLYCKWSL